MHIASYVAIKAMHACLHVASYIHNIHIIHSCMYRKLGKIRWAKLSRVLRVPRKFSREFLAIVNNQVLINNQVLRKIKVAVESDVKNWAYISLR